MLLPVLERFRVLLAPGLHNSGPRHWQSRWQDLYPAMERVEQQHWDRPELPVWSARLDQVRGLDSRPTLIVAHSFGSLATVHSLAADARRVAAVLLVAPADPDKFGVAALLPEQPLPCPSIMIGSGDDPWMTAKRAALWGQRWNCEFINAGMLGHINAESGLGDWQFGQRQLLRLAQAALA